MDLAQLVAGVQRLRAFWLEDIVSLLRNAGINGATVTGDNLAGPIPGTVIPYGAAGYPVDVAATEADGAATLAARSDHVHAHGSGYLADAHHATLTLGANPGLVLSTQELVLGTPSTLTVATINAVAGANHSHAITSSANPGAAASLLAVDASGFLTLVKLTLSSALVTAQAEVTVANCNKYFPYLQDAQGVYLRHQTYYWNGSSYVATENYGFGYAALQNNTGASVNGFGHLALLNNTGSFASGFGYAALQNNTGSATNGFGYVALQSNTGTASNGFGSYALQYNTGSSASGFGSYALQYNTGASVNGFGRSALVNNNWPNVLGLGHQTVAYFLDNAASDKAFTDAEITANTITFGAVHGFGTTDAKVNLRFTTIAGTPPTGLVSLTVYQFTITSATVMTLTGIGTNASADFEGKLTNSVDIHNSVAIGLDANATKPHQVMLGGADIVETYLRGKVGLGVTPTAALHLPAATAAAATASLKIDAGIVATTPVSGNIESDGTNLWWTDSGGTRRQLNN